MTQQSVAGNCCRLRIMNFGLFCCEKAYRFSPHGLQLCDRRRTGKAAKLIDLYARFNFVIL